MRIGMGYDVHRLEVSRPLWLGGIQIPHTHGAVGHSDADVLLHALCDALLGALALGDIGQHFPNTDERWKGIDSKILLKQVMGLIHGKGYVVGNIDVSLTLEKPKVMRYAADMRQVIASICEVTTDDVSIKATTGEGMGFVGRGEGLEAFAIVLLVKK